MMVVEIGKISFSSYEYSKTVVNVMLMFCNIIRWFDIIIR